MHTIQDQPSEGSPRRRRFHSDEFKAVAVAAAAQPGVSLAAVAMAHGINANLLRRWVRDAEAIRDPALDRHSKALPAASTGASGPDFLPVQLPPLSAAPPQPLSDIRLEVRRGTTIVVVTWPGGLAAECGSWLRELLR